MARVLSFLFHNLIFIDPGYQCKSSLNEMDTAGAVDKAYGEDFAFKPFRLPVHSAGSIHPEDLDFGSSLNHGSVLFHDIDFPGDDFILDAVVSIGVHIPVALKPTDDVDDGSAGDGFQVRDVLTLPGCDREPGGFDDVGAVVPLIRKFGDDGEAA